MQRCARTIACLVLLGILCVVAFGSFSVMALPPIPMRTQGHALDQGGSHLSIGTPIRTFVDGVNYTGGRFPGDTMAVQDGTGSFAVADPSTLAWRYYVKLDPAYIDKAMFAEVSPNGKLLWTSNGGLNGGHDLLAYDMSEITAANAAPDGPLLKPAIVLRNAVPPGGVTGATFYKHQFLVANQRPDGSWKNRFNDAKEDDPLIATAWASSALAISKLMLQPPK